MRFDGQVAIVTGAGNGLGRAHARALAARGAKVVVNDLGARRDGSGSSLSAAEEVVEEIGKAGGEAVADGANVTNEGEVAAMVAAAMKKWGRVDILVNNAGILRDKTFAKMEMADFRAVVDVHLVGSAVCTSSSAGPPVPSSPPSSPRSLPIFTEPRIRPIASPTGLPLRFLCSISPI